MYLSYPKVIRGYYYTSCIRKGNPQVKTLTSSGIRPLLSRLSIHHTRPSLSSYHMRLPRRGGAAIVFSARLRMREAHRVAR